MGASSRSEEDEHPPPPQSSSFSGTGAGSAGSGWKHGIHRSASHLSLEGAKEGPGGSGGAHTNGPLRPYSPVAETLFRKDLISAMKLPDNEPLTSDDYWIVTDTWKQEWEKGVQVPVKPENLPEPRVSAIDHPPHSANRFQFPRKLLCMNRSGVYTPETHQITPMALRAEQVCSYDLDDMDQRWMSAFNGERALMGATTINELEMEKTMEELERQCFDKIHSTLKSNEEADEQDDSVICDVCRSPDSEDANEMVFCDQCNICVHQACYGITSIPSGQWHCRTCSLGIKPKCELCPNRGGAMKATKTGQKWAHVSCALWIPEVSIGCVEKMEPITKISSIPASRWNLICVLCKEKVGSCIQCSVKTCKIAYHVTCAFKRGLEMRAIIEDENAEDGVKLRSYCQKHSLNQKRRDSEDSDDDEKGKKKHLTAEERSALRREKIFKIEAEFYKQVDLKVAVRNLDLDSDIVDFIYRYWLLKRKANGNKALLVVRSEGRDLLSTNQETEREKMKKFVALRQDLERVRNLCYMVSRREKLQRSFVKLREQILAKQLALLADENCASHMSLIEMSAVLEANHGPNVYDRVFSHPEAETHTENDFEVIISRISGEIAENSAQIRRDNPYRKGVSGTTGADSGESLSYKRMFSDMSASETDDVLHPSSSNLKKRKNKEKYNKSNHRLTTNNSSSTKRGSSATSKITKKTPAVTVSSNSSIRKKTSSRVRSSDSSMSESDYDKLTKTTITTTTTSSTATASSSTKLNSKKSSAKENKKSKSIFSESESDTDSKSRPNPPVFRTKGAMKDFSVEGVARGRKPASSKVTDLSKKSSIGSAKLAKKKPLVKSASDKRRSESGLSASDDSHDDIGRTSQQEIDDVMNVLIVPERAAARKAAAKLKQDRPAGGAPLPEGELPASESKDESSSLVSGTTHLPTGSSKSGRTKKRSSSKTAASSMDDSDLSDKETHENDDDEEETDGKKKSFSIFDPAEVDLYGYVPQRKAAKKASAYLKESDQKTLNREDAIFEVPEPGKFANKKSPGRPRKKEFLPPMSERLRLSDSDSDLEEPFPVRSPRGKVSRGRGPSSAPKSPRKSTGPKAASRAPKKEKALSSRAEAFLSQRESQLDDIFEQCGFATKKPKKESDAKEQQSSEATPSEVGKASSTIPNLTEEPNQQAPLPAPPPPPTTTSVATKDSSSRSSSSGSSSGSSSSSSSSEDEERSSRVRPSEEFKSPTTKQRRDGDHLVSPSRAGDKHSPSMVQPSTGTVNVDPVNLPGSRALTPKAISDGNRTPSSTSGERVPATPEQIPEFAHDDPKKRPLSAASSSFSPPRSPFRSEGHSSSSLRGDLKESEMDRPPPTPGAGLLLQASGRSRSATKGKYSDDFATAPSPYSRGIPSPGSPGVMDDDDDYDITKSPSLPLSGVPPHLKENNNSSNNNIRNSRSNSSRVPIEPDIGEPPRKSSIESKDSDKDSGQSGSSQHEISRENRVPPDHPDHALSQPEQECTSAKRLGETEPTPVTLNNRQKQTDDSGFDSDEKAAQQNQQQALDQFNQQLQSPNDSQSDKIASPQVHKHLNNQEKRPVGSTPLGTLPTNQRSGSASLANAHSSSDQRYWKQFGSETEALQGHHHQLHGQPDPRSPGTNTNNWLNEMTQGAQKEALYNYMMQRKMSTSNAYSQNSQNQYAAMEQMKQIYAKNYDNLDLLSQLQQTYPNPQYLQYVQMYGGNNFATEIFEQFLQQQGWGSQSSSAAWLGQDSMSKMMGMNQQQLQQFQSSQQHHHLQFSQATAKPGQHSSSSSMSKSSISHSHHQHQGVQQQHHHPSAQNAHQQSMLSHHSQQHFFPSDSSSSGLHPGQYGNKVQTNSTSSHHAPSAAGAKASASSTSSSSSLSVTSSVLPTTTTSTTTPTSSSSSSQSRHNNESHSTPQVVAAAQQQQQQQQQQPPPPPPQVASRKKDSPPPNRSQKLGNSKPGSMDVPSATPVDSLPGYQGSKKEAKSLENQEPFCISKDLLDSVAAVSKLPVWKPDSERDSEISSPPQKTPDHNRMSGGASVPGDKAPQLIRRTSSDRDRSFENLVQRVESSPSQKEPPLKTRLLDFSKFSNNSTTPSSQGPNNFTPTTPAYSETRESQQSMSDYDYDDTKGGVDYDDFEGEDDDYRPCAKSRGKAQTPSTAAAGMASAKRPRGRGRPRGSATSRGKGRGRTKMKTVSIDSEALEKVHKTVAGTDYDFENEFEDDFGDRKEPDLSLQALREQTKRQNAILDAQKIDDHPSTVNEFSFSEYDQIIPSSKANKRSARGAKLPTGLGRGRGRGRARGRPRKTPELQPSPTASDDIPDREPTDDEFTEEEPAPPPHPKLPKLKIGALLIKRESPKGSPKPPKSSKSSKKKSQGEKLTAKVPKLKIKLGPKPEPSAVITSNSEHLKEEPKSTSKTNLSGDDSGQDTLAAMAAELEASAPPHKSQPNVTVKSDPIPFTDRAKFGVEDPLKADPDLKKPNEKIDSNTVAKSKETKPSPSTSTKSNVAPISSVTTTSPKKGSRIDSLADRLLGASKSSSSSDLGNGDKKLREGAPTSDLDTIFGPPVPLDMSTSSEPKKPSEILTTSVTGGFGTSTSTSGFTMKQPPVVKEQLSELDLLKKELEGQMATSRSSTANDDAPRVVHGPKKKALNAAGYKKHEDNNSGSNDHRSQHLKMKFKVQSGAERVTNNPDPVSIPIASTGDSNAQSNFSSASSYNPKPMMRKKVLLNHYYGKEIYPEIPNGPVPQPPAIQEEHQPAVRNIIKMPKAVASVTSVPTRADYQPQLEANLERKRKRDKGLESSNKSNDRDNDKAKGDKGGKKKRGRGSKQHTDDDYKPKSIKVETGQAQNEEGKEKARKTRGKPPKKCLAESPPHDEDSGDLKAANMKYAEQIMASFDADEPSKGKKEAAKRGRKRKKKDEPGIGGGGPAGTKTPRLVIKFSKDGSKEGTPGPNSPLDAHDDLDKRNGSGLSAFDFEDDPLMVDGNMEVESLDTRSSNAKIPKIKIKL